MKLISLKLENFKGKNFNLDTNGENTNIFGANETGKTTVADSVSWLLYDKDSLNKKDFDIKSLQENGEPIHGLNHAVEATFSINGKQLTLRKIFSEKWTKKKGAPKAVFTGHTTDYFINGVPAKKGEYTAKIAEIAGEDIFRLLTNPLYFSAVLHWQERRKILLDACGDISDRDVIDGMTTLNNKDEILALTNILNQRTLDDHRKMITAKKTEVNKNLSSLPIRVDEVTKSLPDVEGISTVAIQSKIDTVKKRIRDNEQKISRIKGGGEIAEKQKHLAEIDAQLLDIQTQYRKEYQAKIEAKQEELRATIGDTYTNSNLVKSLTGDINIAISDIERLDARIIKTRAYWHTVNGRTFEFEQNDTCPTCNQPLPAERLAEARKVAEEDFNLKKSTELASVKADGVTMAEQVKELTADKAKLETSLTKGKAQLEAINVTVNELTAEIGTLQQALNQYQSDPVYISKLSQKQTIAAEIENLKSGSQDETVKIKAENNMLEAELTTAKSRLNDFEIVRKGNARIEELKAQEKVLAAEFERIEGELYLCDLFVKTKVSLLTDKINSKFKLARFKLFENQINGVLTECCETTYKGVPYNSNLNNGARILVGIDIINTLSEHYGFTPVLFIDNSESVTYPIETKGQVVKLIVSEKDKTLRVETEGKNIMREAV